MHVASSERIKPSPGQSGAETKTVLEAIAHRRTVSRFDPEGPLDDATIALILQAATFAPSEGNLQPWRFLVVRSQANRKKLRACVQRNPIFENAPVTVVVLGYHSPHLSHLEAMLQHRRVRKALSPECEGELRARIQRRMSHVEDLARWSTQIANRAVALLVLAAESLGVGSAIVEVADEPALKEAFGIPDDHSVCCLVALGVPAERPTFPGRFSLDEVCFQEHFGQPWPEARRTDEHERVSAGSTLASDPPNV